MTVKKSDLESAVWLGGESLRVTEAYLESLGYSEEEIDLALAIYCESCAVDARPEWAAKKTRRFRGVDEMASPRRVVRQAEISRMMRESAQKAADELRKSEFVPGDIPVELYPAPLIRGGQGRTGTDICEDAEGLLLPVGLALFAALGIAAGAVMSSAASKIGAALY